MHHFSTDPISAQAAILGPGGKLLFLLQRQQIEGHTPEQIAAALAAAYEGLSEAVGSDDSQTPGRDTGGNNALFQRRPHFGPDPISAQ